MSQDHTLGSENYRVVFLGVTEGSGTGIQAFSQNLSKQFQIPIEKALRIAKSAPLVIKKNVSRSKAERYRQVFGKLGGQVRIEQTDGGIEDHASSAATGRVDGFETTAIDSHRPVGGSSDPAAQITGVESDQAIGEAYDDAIAGAYEDSFTPPTHGTSKVLEAQGFQCPSCGLEQPKGTECIKCGIVFQKYEQMADAALHASAEAGEDATRFEPMPRDMEVNIEHAGFWIRAGAYVVDSVVLFGIFFAIGILLFMTLRPDRNPTALASLNPLFNLISLFLPFGYFIYYLGKRGYTPGKGFLGLQVIRTDGSGVTYGDAAIRTFSYILSSIPLYLGFLWIAFDKGKQGWHDKIAKTQVIRAED
ncbi:MAG: hypothetical protein GTO24_15835, partial [candidate division Zixibacteria bacterium]|nr:hypothetical protein [candidate division Zixibacteria bacterium]